MIYIIAGMFGLSILLGIIGLFKPVDKPIQKIHAFDERTYAPERVTFEKHGPIQSMADRLPKTLFQSDKRSRRMIALKQSDIPLTVEEFFIVQWMGRISLPFLAYALTESAVAVGITFVALEGFVKVLFNIRRQRKIKRLSGQLNEGITLIANALKAGYSFLQALAVSSKETEAPLSKEFGQLLKEMSLGMSMEDALGGLIQRTPSEDLKLMVNAILIQKDIGGNLSEILENIAITIRERQKILNEVRALTAQGRLSGMIIMAMPLFVGIIIYLLNPEYLMVLFTTTVGKGLIVLAVVNQIIGWLIIRKIVNVEF